jgi:hypothetical protein
MHRLGRLIPNWKTSKKLVFHLLEPVHVPPEDDGVTHLLNIPAAFPFIFLLIKLLNDFWNQDRHNTNMK